MPGPIARRIASLALVVGPLAAIAGCGDGSASPPRSTVAATSTTYLTVPARSTTTVAPRPENEVAPVGGGGDADVANPEPSAAADPNQERIHEIRSGDHLVGIARDYDVPLNYIPEFNGWTDGLGHALVPGDTIRIPPADWLPEAERRADTSEPAGDTTGSSADDGCGTYRIRRGDTKGRVAAAHDVTVAELDAANAGTQFYEGFVIGIDIVIPC